MAQVMVTNKHGVEMCVNTSHIVRVYSNPDGLCVILMSDGAQIATNKNLTDMVSDVEYAEFLSRKSSYNV